MVQAVVQAVVQMVAQALVQMVVQMVAQAVFKATVQVVVQAVAVPGSPLARPGSPQLSGGRCGWCGSWAARRCSGSGELPGCDCAPALLAPPRPPEAPEINIEKDWGGEKLGDKIAERPESPKIDPQITSRK